METTKCVICNREIKEPQKMVRIVVELVSSAQDDVGDADGRVVGDVPPDSCWNDSINVWLYAAGDVNGNCDVLGSDLSYFISYFRSINPEILWCPQTPPPDRILSRQNDMRKSRRIKEDSR